MCLPEPEAMFKQFIPSDFCLGCLGCCRFAKNPSLWAPSEGALIKDKSGYVCAELNQEDNRCKIYAKRPLDCQLYPFLLVRKGDTLQLGLHKSCCFIQDKSLTKSGIQSYGDYLKRKLTTPQCISALRKNYKIAADYQEEVAIVGDLQNVYIKAFALKFNPDFALGFEENGLNLCPNKACEQKNRRRIQCNTPRTLLRAKRSMGKDLETFYQNPNANSGFNSLTLKNKPLVERYLKKSNCSISTYHFANIFVWKDLFRIFWLKIGMSLCIFYQDALGMFMALPPLGEVNESIITRCFAAMNSYNKNSEISRIENIPEDDLEKYKEARLTAKLKDTEYVCLREDLAALKGDNFKSKRAGYNHFVKHYHPEVLEYNKNMYKECLGLYQLWADTRKCEARGVLYQQMLEDSRISFQAALRYYHALSLSGYVVKVKGKIKACSLGYPLNKEVFCILFEVCDLRLKGIAQCIFREFARRLSGYAYINIMGASELENLKQAKLSYKPLKTINVYNVYQ